MTPQQREAALRLADELARIGEHGAGSQITTTGEVWHPANTMLPAAALLRELAAEPDEPVAHIRTWWKPSHDGTLDIHAELIDFEDCIDQLPEGEHLLYASPPDWESLRDPATLHANLLRGQPAQLSREQFLHLAGEPVQKPVCWGWRVPDGRITAIFSERKDNPDVEVVALYASPPQRQPLTFAELCELMPPDFGWNEPCTPALVRHILEAAHGIGETP